MKSYHTHPPKQAFQTTSQYHLIQHQQTNKHTLQQNTKTMAPVTATAAGVARQTIDDPTLISLLERLSKFDRSSSPLDGGGDGADGTTIQHGDDGGGEDVAMGDGGEAAAGEGDKRRRRRQPPVDIDGLVAELEKVPRWRFQEQVRSSSEI